MGVQCDELYQSHYNPYLHSVNKKVKEERCWKVKNVCKVKLVCSLHVRHLLINLFVKNKVRKFFSVYGIFMLSISSYFGVFTD